jgi:hypothetical protein
MHLQELQSEDSLWAQHDKYTKSLVRLVHGDKHDKEPGFDAWRAQVYRIERAAAKMKEAPADKVNHVTAGALYKDEYAIHYWYVKEGSLPSATHCCENTNAQYKRFGMGLYESNDSWLWPTNGYEVNIAYAAMQGTHVCIYTTSGRVFLCDPDLLSDYHGVKVNATTRAAWLTDVARFFGPQPCNARWQSMAEAEDCVVKLEPFSPCFCLLARSTLRSIQCFLG